MITTSNHLQAQELLIAKIQIIRAETTSRIQAKANGHEMLTLRVVLLLKVKHQHLRWPSETIRVGPIPAATAKVEAKLAMAHMKEVAEAAKEALIVNTAQVRKETTIAEAISGQATHKNSPRPMECVRVLKGEGKVPMIQATTTTWVAAMIEGIKAVTRTTSGVIRVTEEWSAWINATPTETTIPQIIRQTTGWEATKACLLKEEIAAVTIDTIAIG